MADENDEISNERTEVGDIVINPHSVDINKNAFVEDGVNYSLAERYQFMRNGYYALDSVDSKENALVFNQVVGLKNS